MTRRLSSDVSLASSAWRAARSRFQFHRQFRRVTGETLKQYTLRLRLERAAARLLASDHTVLDIAGIHAGPYEGLPQTNAAIEQWIEENGFAVGGAPWEQYVTDPGEHPDPADWRTEVYWPLL